MPDAPHPKLDDLIAVLERLRGPGGCAWDREQTHESLVRYLIEETWELVDAIESGNRDDLIEELGDVLYQVVFHSDIAANASDEPFTIEDVAERMTAKMVARHPHVFADTRADTAADVVAVWEDVKAKEKSARTSVIDGIPQRMPSLLLADKLIGRAHKVGVIVAAATESIPTEEEFGDRLLSLVSEGRDQGLDAERALRGALRRLQGDIRSAEAETLDAG